MARKIINTGSYANDGAGDDLRTGATKINDNFQELYSAVDNISLATTGVAVANGIGYGYYGIMFDGSTQDSFGTATRLVPEDPTQINTITLRDSSGEVAFVDDIGRIINQNYILNIKNSGYELKDENEILQLIYANSIDSARAVAITIDSAELLAAVDSAYVQARQVFGTPGEFQPYIDSAVNILRTDHDSDITANRYDIDFLLSNQAALNTGDVTEDPANLYYTDARVDSNFGTKTTADLTEGANLYYTKSRTDSDISQAFGNIAQDLIPAADSTYDLGSPTNKWKDLHLSGSTIFLGNTTITNDGSNINFGVPINAEIVVANSMDLGSNVIQSSSNHIRIRPAGGKDVRLETIDGAPIFTASTNGYIYVGDSASGILGNTGWLHLGNNTTANRNTSVATNGAIHYNETDHTFEFKDSDGWFALDRNVVAGTYNKPVYWQFGLDGQHVGGAIASRLLGPNGSNSPQGVVLPVAGILSNITMSAEASSHSGGSLTHSIAIYKNNSYQTGVSVEVTSAGNVFLNETLNISYNAGDKIHCNITNDTGMTTENHSVILRALES
jgi:hypothetical protein